MIRELAHKAWLGLTRNVAFTAPAAADDRLRGRTYAIPFEEVWQSSLHLVDGGLKRWELLEYDDREGIIRGLSRGWTGSTSAITVRVTLDADAQTRVDALAASRVGRMDLGANVRRLHRFFRSLDAAVSEARSRRRRIVRQSTGA
ncbi:MAG TPA: DUF1499 domain-containing protein [Longimicrobiales bacterium]|nr:DUF1499 domain-containing protein [Longimicrobiales bacterium]